MDELRSDTARLFSPSVASERPFGCEAAAPTTIDTRTMALKDVTAVGILSGSPGLSGAIDAYASGSVGWRRGDAGDPRRPSRVTIESHDPRRHS